MKFWRLIGFTTLISGCSSAPTDQEIDAADFGLSMSEETGRYTGMTPFSGIVRDEGDGPRVVRYCITSGTKDYRFCIPSMVD